jgi:tetratricopeptide (TPR) repeat protein
MSESPNKFIKFWLELKRRKVFGVVTTYAATAYIIIEVINNLAFPLNLPAWVATLVLVILLIGLPIVIIIAWIFDFTPKGIEKTEPLEESKSKEIIIKPVKSKLRASYVLNAILIIAVIILAYPKVFKPDSLERLRSSGERISVAVMPFQNMTNDTNWNIWQNGIQDMLITSLSNFPEELIVRQTESINNLIQSKGLTNYATITPTFAGSISQKLDANVFIYGSLKQAGSTLRIYTQLIDSESKTVLKSFQIEDSAKEENIFHLIDSLSTMVKDFLIISKLIKEGNPALVKLEATTKNPEAFKSVINGNRVFFTNRDYPSAINHYEKAFAIDSTYQYPAIMIAYAFWNQGLYEEGKKWCQKTDKKLDQIPLSIKTSADVIHAMYYETPYESINYLRRLLEIDDQLPDVYTDIGYEYIRLQQYSNAIPELERALEIYEEWGIKPLWSFSYVHLLNSLRHTGQHKKAKILIKEADKNFPDDNLLTYEHAIISIIESDTIAAKQYIEKYRSLARRMFKSEADIITNLGWMYWEAGVQDKAEEYLRLAKSLEPENYNRWVNLAWLIFDKDRKIKDGILLIEKALEFNPDQYDYLDTKGWGLYKQGKYKEALEILQKSWVLRREKAVYDHYAFLHLEAAKKAVAGQNIN